MKNTFKGILSLFAVVGLFAGVLHYHSEAMECLEHTGEQHYVENTLLCPICAVDFTSETPDVPDYKHQLSFTEELLLPQILFLTEDSSFTRLSRAPPFMV